MIADLFYIVLFVTAFGSAAWMSIMFLQHVMKIRVAFRLCSLMMFFYLIPFFSPGLRLVAQDQNWLPAFLTASGVWAVGFCVSAGCLMVRNVYAYLAARKYAPCQDEPVIRVLQDCFVNLKMKRLPEVLYGDLKEPACVISFGRPKIILSERIVRQLTGRELTVILTHELIHIRRGHLFLQKCFDLIVCIHWFNPFVWAARHEFSLSCEMDCDQTIFRNIPGLSAPYYTNLMLKTMELTLPNRHNTANAIGALDFMLARQRFQSILSPASTVKKCCSVILSFAIMAAVVSGSLFGSKSYFYPASTGNTQMERSVGYE